MRGIVRDSAAIAFKELKQLSRDPVSLALTIIFPILLVSIVINISAAFGAPSYNIPTVVVDLDSTPASKILFEKFARSQVLQVTELSRNEERAFKSVESGEASGAVIIPKGFGGALLAGKQAFIVLATDNSKFISATLVRNAVNRSAQDVMKELGTEDNLGTTPIEVIFRPVSGRPPSGDIILPGMLGMIIILGAFDDILNAVSRERERGTFPRLLLSPTNILSIYLGKIVSALLLTLFRTLLMLFIFGLIGLVIRGSIFLIFLTTSLIGLFTLSLGLVISSRIRSSSTLTVLEIAITFPLFQLTASTDSRQSLAEAGRAISSFLPWTYGNEALRRIIYLGLGFDVVASSLLVLLVSSLIMLPIALILSERTM